MFILHWDTNAIQYCSHFMDLFLGMGPDLCYGVFTLTSTETCTETKTNKIGILQNDIGSRICLCLWQYVHLQTILYVPLFIGLGISLGLCQCECTVSVKLLFGVWEVLS